MKKKLSEAVTQNRHGSLPDNACPSCGATMVVKRGTLYLPVNGEEIAVPYAAHLSCPNCDEVVLRYQDSKRLGEDAIAIYRQKHGLLSADGIRAIRELFGFTQADLARLLHLGANTVSRWESGRNVQTAAMDILLRLIRDVPGSINYLRDHVGHAPEQVAEGGSLDIMFTLEECAAHLIEFEKLLNNYGIVISQRARQARGASDLVDASYSILEVLFVFRNEMAATIKDDERLARDLVGLGDLMAKLLRVKEHPEFPTLVPHLHYLADCKLLLNQRSSILDQEANKIIELYWAALCLQIGSNLVLDEGGHDSSPDVVVTVDGRRWAFECKTMQAPTQQPRGLTLKDRLDDAVCQINNSQTAEVGIAIINAKNLIAHDRVWTAPGDSAVYESALSVMEEAPLRMVADMESEVNREDLCSMFRGGKSLPGLLFFLQSTTVVHPSQFLSPVAARLNDLLPQFFCDHQVAPEDESVLQRLNDAAMTGFEKRH